MLSQEDIVKKLKPIAVQKLGIKQEEVHLEASFVEDFNADSLDMVELVMAIEEEFNIDIPDSYLEKIVTVSDAVEYIIKNID
uniref:Acyl carrier protein n=1 Tax=Eucheuma denticulatum TaxID=305493 RepID=A0A8E7UFA1_9FLOR|nr:acyl carrier protein [Eucheuma denticulatum]